MTIRHVFFNFIIRQTLKKYLFNFILAQTVLSLTKKTVIIYKGIEIIKILRSFTRQEILGAFDTIGQVCQCSLFII